MQIINGLSDKDKRTALGSMIKALNKNPNQENFGNFGSVLNSVLKQTVKGQ